MTDSQCGDVNGYVQVWGKVSWLPSPLSALQFPNEIYLYKITFDSHLLFCSSNINTSSEIIEQNTLKIWISKKAIILLALSFFALLLRLYSIKVKFHLLGFIVHPQTASVTFYCSFSDILYFILYLYFQYLVLPTPSGWDTCSILTLPTPTELRNWWVQTLRSLSFITYFMSI